MNYHVYTPASDTTELATAYRGPFFERETVAIDFPWFAPSVPTVHYTPRARLRRAAGRFLASGFARDVRRNLPRIPIAVGGLTVGYVGMLVVQAVAMVAAS
jgi:hypothetical protein